MDVIKEFIDELPPYQLSPFEPFHIIIYVDLDIYTIHRFIMKNWKLFINTNTMEKKRPIQFYSVCATTSTTIIDDIINTLFESMRESFVEMQDNEDEMNEENFIKYLDLRLEINLDNLKYNKTKNSA